MIIALDYDDTFTHSPAAWIAAGQVLKQHGYSILGITLRNRYQPVSADFIALCDSIIYCSGQAKDDTAKAFGYNIDIWIDDMPQYIHASYEQIHKEKFHIDNPPDDLYIPLEVKF